MVYIVKHNAILGVMFTNTKAQLLVSAIIVGHLMYNLKMANIDGRNMYLFLSFSKHTTKNRVMFDDIYTYHSTLLVIGYDFLHTFYLNHFSFSEEMSTV
jgi:hypothetical protein